MRTTIKLSQKLAEFFRKNKQDGWGNEPGTSGVEALKRYESVKFLDDVSEQIREADKDKNK